MEGNSNKFNLEDRTYLFARDVREYVKCLPRTISHIEYGKQLIRSSGSVAANYIEANEALSKKDFLMRIKICRKESKEPLLWIKLTEPRHDNILFRDKLLDESMQLMKIFGSIVVKYIK